MEALRAIEESRDELADLAVDLGNTFSPFGSEATLAEAVGDWYAAHGISSEIVPIMEGRANVVARLRGTGDGPSVLFNAHLDTEVSGPDYDALMDTEDLNRVGGRRDGERLFGHTVLNDRACMAAMMVAARSLAASGADLPGDVLLTSVAGETGAAPVDEFRGMTYEGKGLGTEFLARHGVRADFGVVAEMTGFVPVWYHCGAAYYKVTFRGRRTYTPFLVRPAELSGHPNAVVKAAAAVEAVEAWAAAYEESHEVVTPCGIARPKSQVGAIRGGIPWRANRASTYCALYVDVRTLPGADVGEIRRSLAEAVAAVDPAAEVSLFMSKEGTVSVGVEPLVDRVRQAHRSVRGSDPAAEADPAWVSMWRDVNVLNRAGIPSIAFGPGPRQGEDGRWMEVDDLVDAAKIYALIAAGPGAA